MRIATILDDGEWRAAVVRDRSVLPVDASAAGIAAVAVGTVRQIAASGGAGLRRVREWADRQPERAYRTLDSVELGPAVPDPGAIYTIGLNYRPAGETDVERPERPFVYAKLPTSVAGHGSSVSWDHSLTTNVDAEAELGVVIGQEVLGVSPEGAMAHVFGYTCINDMSSRDPWLDGDQWLLGKSLPGFCPVGPSVVTRDEVDPTDLRLGCLVNGIAIQDDSTARMRFSIAEIVSYISRHTVLRPGDLIATGTPARLVGPFGPERHLEAGDIVTVWIEGIGELTTAIA